MGTLIVICALLLIITLFFGLKPEGFRFINQVERCAGHRGIKFTNIGMLYGKKTLDDLGITDSLCITTVIKPNQTGRRLSRIVSIVGDNGRELLTIDQWMADFEVSIWDSSGKRIRRVGIDAGLSPDSFRCISVGLTGKKIWATSDNPTGGSKCREVQLQPGFIRQGRICAGFAATGGNPWQGEMSLLMLTGETSDPERNADILRSDTAAVIAEKINPAVRPRTAIFLFDDPHGERASDRSGNEWDLAIPPFPKLFRHEILIVGDFKSLPDRSQASDIIVNLLGFIPFGFGFFLLFFRMTNRRRIAMVLTLCSAFTVSLGIELAQVFIPTRSSQLVDVVLNVAGAGIGMIFSGKAGQEMLIRFNRTIRNFYSGPT